MSTLKVDRVIGSFQPLPVIEAARDVEVFVAASGQSVFNIAGFDDSFNIRAFVDNEEVDCEWSGAGAVTIATAAPAGARVRIYKVGVGGNEVRVKSASGEWESLANVLEEIETVVGETSKLEVATTNFVAAPYRSYWLAADVVVELPANVEVGTSIEFSKTADATPTIKTTDGTLITINGKSDVEAIYDINARILVVFNGTAWEI